MARDGNSTGIAAMCLAMALFIVNDTAVKLATAHWPVAQIIAVRGAMAGACAVILLAATGRLAHLLVLKHPRVLLRCFLEGIIALSYIAALARLPIADVTAIFMVSPLLITVLAALFLGEDVRWRRWTAVIVGFIGMLIVVNPGGSALNVGVLLVLVSTVGAVLRDLITRSLPKDIPSTGVATGTILVTMVMGMAGMLFVPFVPFSPAAPVLVPVVIAAVTVALGNILIIVAFRNGEISVVSPFRYTLIVWSVAAGVLAFGEWPRPLAWIGIAMIIGSGLYTLHRERIRSRSSAKDQPQSA